MKTKIVDGKLVTDAMNSGSKQFVKGFANDMQKLIPRIKAESSGDKTIAKELDVIKQALNRIKTAAG